MQRHLQEAGASNSVLDHTELTTWRIAPVCKAQGRLSARLVRLASSRRIAREAAEKRIKPYIVIWCIEAGMIEKVKRLQVKLEPKTLGQFELLKDGHVHT